MDILDELIGKPVEEVCSRVSLVLGRVEQIPEGTLTDASFDLNRIRVWYDPITDKVTRITKG